MAEIAIVGGGPAGLAAAERLGETGHRVTVYERMPTVGRKFLLAGKSGLNLTHAEPYERFARRFGDAAAALRPALDRLTPDDLRAWAAGLGIETFAGSSGRIFPVGLKASPLLRAWLRRLAGLGVEVRNRHRWTGLSNGALAFETPEGARTAEADAVILALGGASWPRLGSDGAFVPILEEMGVAVTALAPANCGFDVAWSPVFAERFAGAPVKSVAAAAGGRSLKGEMVVTRTGIEGSLVYAHAAALRDALARVEPAALVLDLLPDRDTARIARDLARQPARQSFSNRLRKATGLEGVKAALLRELLPAEMLADPERLAAATKALAVPVTAPRPLPEAISTAGGVALAEIDERFMLKRRPGVFVAGEMLDWEAPTGGYLLTACLATGRAAAEGAAAWLAEGSARAASGR